MKELDKEERNKEEELGQGVELGKIVFQLFVID